MSVQGSSGSFSWLVEKGVDPNHLAYLNPCVPGEFTLPKAYYLNTATPGLVYRGTAEGTLPLVAGRWYLMPESLADLHPSLTRNAVPVATAVRHIR